MNQPDSLKNALVRMINGQGQRRVIRDDGPNGLWISNPNNPATMYHITREEFDTSWELEKSGDQQDTQDISGTKWGRMGQPTEQVAMNAVQSINTPRIEVTPVEDARKGDAFEARSEITDREAYKREILERPVLDADFSGDPTAANEEPISTFEADRAEAPGDAEAAEQREEELSGQFQTYDAQDAQLDDSDASDNPDEAPAPPTDEPTAGNEDPATEEEAAAEAAPKKRSRKTSK